MNEEQINKLKEIIKEEEKTHEFNDYIENYMSDEDLKNVEDEDDLKEYLETINEDHEITNAEVIYYSNALDYLLKNDPSLMNSLELAEEYGYKTTDLNSELLASLLMTKNNEEDYTSFIDDVMLRSEEIFKKEE